ncbi:glycerol-3-phosphate dehydrogenase/oxidase [Arenicella sp. 4NH20-0111]|uniref:glycerol-3-phosphate dehydrogenase/oxidase n=1 Tax=Arenicella sp. 4NH20-0111 TaxID=3127648 RepID=UPI003104AEA8
MQQRDISKLTQTEFDVVIIGGGISGAWLSLHCVQQGYKTALIERADFASSTSSASSKLLHGGIRYLQQFQFDKVRESALERAQYMYAAPHLSKAVPFVVPTYPDFKRSKFFLNCGMIAYRLLCLGENRLIGSRQENLPSIHSIKADALNTLCDLSQEKHTGAVVFYERHMLDSERMVLSILQSAQELGAQTFNYVSAEGFTGEDDEITGIAAKDQLTGNKLTIASKLVINAAGPFIDNLNSKLKSARHAPSINGFAVGSHIVTRQLCDHAIALTTKHQSNAKVDRGGRHVFVIPWRGHSLIGTSYDEIDSPNGDISIQADHVEQLLEAVNDGWPSAKLTRSDIVSGYSGLYPLHTENIKNTVYQGSGEYQIIDHQQANGVSGMITALGAKFTTGRKISALTMTLINRRLGGSKKISKTRLCSADYENFTAYRQNKLNEYQDQLGTELIDHLLMLYGSQFDQFVETIKSEPALRQKICSSQPDILGQVTWAITHEQALTLDDVLYGRTSLGLLGIHADELLPIADTMAELLRWSEQERKQQLERSVKRLLSTDKAIHGQQA